MLFLASGSAKIIIQTQMILICNCGFWNKIDYTGNIVSINVFETEVMVKNLRETLWQFHSSSNHLCFLYHILPTFLDFYY